jgi:O-methyltransferase
MSTEPTAGVANKDAGAISLYLELLKDILVNNIYGRFEYIAPLQQSSSRMRSLGFILLGVIRLFKFFRREKSLEGYPLITKSFDHTSRNHGHDWPAYAYTMVGRKRLDHLQLCLDTIEQDGIPGDLVETGIWRGGVCIFMTGYLKIHGVGNRTVWGLDSFEGLPKPNAEDFPADKGDKHYTHRELRVDLESVRENIRVFGLLDDKIRLVKGFFSQTIPKLPVQKIAILRLDGDMYESTMVVLNNLYSKVAPGGFIVIDDYSLKNCRMAIDDFMRMNEIVEPVSAIDEYSAYWRKSD